MRFNPQMLMQLLAQKNPQAMQQLQQFQQILNTNTQMKQQYDTFRNNLSANPQLQEKAMMEAMQKVNNLPPIGGTGNNPTDKG